MAKTIDHTMARNIPLVADKLAFSNFFSPRLLDSRAFIPTPVPTEIPIISCCNGNTNVRAVKAFSFIWATNILSTIL